MAKWNILLVCIAAIITFICLISMQGKCDERSGRCGKNKTRIFENEDEISFLNESLQGLNNESENCSNSLKNFNLTSYIPRHIQPNWCKKPNMDSQSCYVNSVGDFLKVKYCLPEEFMDKEIMILYDGEDENSREMNNLNHDGELLQSNHSAAINFTITDLNDVEKRKLKREVFRLKFMSDEHLTCFENAMREMIIKLPTKTCTIGKFVRKLYSTLRGFADDKVIKEVSFKIGKHLRRKLLWKCDGNLRIAIKFRKKGGFSSNKVNAEVLKNFFDVEICSEI